MIPPWQYGAWYFLRQQRRSKMTPAEKASDDSVGGVIFIIAIVIFGIIFLFKKH